MAVIEAQNIKKYYGRNAGTVDVSFSVEKGEIFGFVGPNGAGKSTTIKVLLGFIFATEGSASIGGLDVVRDTKEIKKFTGYVPSDVHLYGNMRISELLRRNSRFYGADGQGDEAGRLCNLLELDTTRRFNELSSGNRKKAAIICAMAPKPSVLILDEPTNGLDPLAQKKLFAELQNQAACGVTVLLSSHNLAEVQEYCDKVAFIKSGRILAVTEIKGVRPNKIVTIRNAGKIPDGEVDVLEHEGEKAVFRYSGDGAGLLALLGRFKPDDFTVENESIEEQFMKMYQEEEQQ